MFWQVCSVYLLAVLTLTSAQCGRPGFIPVYNMHISGGVLRSEFTDLNSCQNGCTSENSCFSIDTADNPFSCYFLTDPQVPLTTEAGVTHYNITQQCSNGDQSCTYQDYGGYTFYFYNSVETQTSFDNCAARCISLGTSCTGFSYNEALSTSNCKLATSDIAFTNYITDQSWKMMKKSDCQFACTVYYGKRVDKSSPNGVQDQAASSEEQCKTSCNNNPSCIGFDLDMTGAVTTCWIHTDMTNFRNVRNSTGVTQYEVIARCPTTPCQATFSILSDTSSPFGTMQPNIITEQGCKDACAENLDCVGFDLDRTGSDFSCWIHTSFQEQRSTTNIDQYRLTDRCPQAGSSVTVPSRPTCSRSYSTKYGFSSPNGVRFLSAVSWDDCKAACDSLVICVAFDLDTNPTTPACYLHLNQADLNTAYSSSGVTQYVAVGTCDPGTTTNAVTTSSGCQINWQVKPDTSSVGGVLNSAYTTEDSCKAACISTSTCVAVDINFNKSPIECWFHEDLAKISVTRPDPGVSQYILDRCYTPGVCVTSWKTYTDSSSSGGMLQTGQTSIEGCQNLCINTQTCVAVDVNLNKTPPECWLHDNANNIATRRTDPGVNQYVVNRCSTGCQIKWTELADKGSAGGALQPGVNTAVGCQDLCASTSSCVAVDYNTVSNECWMHTDPNAIKVTRPDTSVIQYVIDRCYQDPCPDFTMYEDQHASGGIQQASVTSQPDCEQSCLNNANCQGYDYDFTINGCFIFNDKKSPTELSQQTGTNHYELVCRAGETPRPTITTTRSDITTSPPSLTTRG